MKKLFSLIVLACLIQACGDDKCTDERCKKETKIAQGSDKIIVSDTNNITCKLTTAELQKRKTDVLAVIKSKVKEKKELNEGYSFKFDNTDEMIDMLTDFIKSERQCCDFFNFSISVKNDGSLWFDLTGPKDAKEMIEGELGL